MCHCRPILRLAAILFCLIPLLEVLIQKNSLLSQFELDPMLINVPRDSRLVRLMLLVDKPKL